jgi:hypothetical protein
MRVPMTEPSDSSTPTARVPTIFLLSPARLDGERGRALLDGKGASALMGELRSAHGCSVEAVFCFVSSLYFRGKAAYARAFGVRTAPLPSAYVMTAGGGLLSLDEPVTVARLEGWSRVAVSPDNPHFVAPLLRHATGLLDACDQATRFVLLGSVASRKYVGPLLDVFGERLLYPSELAGRGDMARGKLLLAAAREQRELGYASVRDLQRFPRAQARRSFDKP